MPQTTTTRDRRGTGRDLAPLPNELAFMQVLWALVHRLDKTSKHMGRHLGVTGPQRLALRIVGLFPGVSAGDVAAVLHVHPRYADRRAAAPHGAAAARARPRPARPPAGGAAAHRAGPSGQHDQFRHGGGGRRPDPGGKQQSRCRRGDSPARTARRSPRRPRRGDAARASATGKTPTRVTNRAASDRPRGWRGPLPRLARWRNGR